MNKTQVEDWVLQVVEQAQSGRHTEDFRVEMKREWIAPQKAARQLAGHANAARGEPILWIVGVDEEKGVVGAQCLELADWRAQVLAEFDGLMPAMMMDLNVPVSQTTVVAMLFETDRAPYVVKNPRHGGPDGGSILFEVPWREGRSTSSCTRSQLLRILAPLQITPEIELIYARVRRDDRKSNDGTSVRHWYLHEQLYVTPRSPDRLVIPFHRCSVCLSLPGGTDLVTGRGIELHPPTSRWFTGNGIQTSIHSLTAQSTRTEVILDGPSMIEATADIGESPVDRGHLPQLKAILQMKIVGADLPITVEAILQRQSDEDAVKESCMELWVYGRYLR